MRKTVLCIAVIALAIFTAHAQQANPESDFDFKIIDNGAAVLITGYTGTAKVAHIPERIENLPVTRIGDRAFLGAEWINNGDDWNFDFTFVEGNRLTEIAIPQSVTYIGAKAFSGNLFTNLIIPDSVVVIEYEAFSGNELTDVSIGNGVKYIGESAFYGNPLTDVSIPSEAFMDRFAFGPSSVTITRREQLPDDENAFSFRIIDNGAAVEIIKYLRNNIEARIPERLQNLPVTHIGQGAFAGGQRIDGAEDWPSTYIPKNLKSVIIPEGVTHIGAGAFLENELTYVSIPESVRHIGDWAFEFNDIWEIKIPEGVTHIGKGAFAYNWMNYVSIPESITYIGEGAFFDNSGITNVNVPIHAEILPNAFAERTTVTRSQQRSDYERDFSFRFIDDGTAIEIVRYFGSATDVVIPEQIQGLPVTSIFYDAFNQQGLTGVIIPDSVTHIGSSAFRHNQLTEITIPSGVTKIDYSVFEDNQLTSVSIPGGVTHISPSAFANNRLASVVIPHGVTHIDNKAFWKNELVEVIIPDSVTHIGDEAFRSNQLTEVSVPSHAEIDRGAFDYGIAVIRRQQQGSDENAFYVALTNDGAAVMIVEYVGSDTEVSIPPRIQGLPVTGIGADAFRGKKLTGIIIPDSVRSISQFAFAENNLSSVIIPDSVRSINWGVFDENQLTSVTIPNSITGISFAAFRNNRLAGVIIPDSVTIIATAAFEGNQLTGINIPDSVTEIYGWAFAGNRLTEIDIPDSVTYIGEGAFARNKLTKVSVPSGADVNPDAFDPEVEVTRRSSIMEEKGEKK